MTQHTPGSWRFGAESEKRGDSKRLYGPGNILVATVAHPIEMTSRRHSANARLIAAAPDLYNAVMDVLIASEDGGEMDDIDWDGLRAAIAKAEGRG